MAAPKRPKVGIDLRDLSPVGPLLADHARRHYGVCASFCFRRHRPRGPVVLSVATDTDAQLLVVGLHRITKAIKATLGDEDDAVEHGAYGVALLAAARVFGVRLVRRSFKGPGFDFYISALARPTDPDDIFRDCWGFEVSGIMAGDRRAINTRLNRKRTQVADATRLLPVLIAIVEFSLLFALFELQPIRP